tara:strand:- start:4399 stop:17130 length:12732 start_codon:yes stop_codon:yes gene_type:complete
MSDKDNLFSVLGNLRSADETLDTLRRKREITDNILENNSKLQEQDLSGQYWYDAEQGAFKDDATDTDYADAVEAEWDLGAADTPRGLTGAYNRKRFLDRSQSMLSLARTIRGIDNNATLDALAKSAKYDYSESGWAQMGRGAVGAINIFQDMTADTKQFKEQVKAEIGAGVPQDLELHFTPEKFVKAVRETRATALAMDEYGITAESLKGVSNYADAVEALSTQLWMRGREQRASQQVLSKSESTLKFAANLGNMILQDPDMAAEIGLEVGSTIAVGVISAGTAIPAFLAARIARRGASLTKQGLSITKIQRKLERGESITRGWEAVARAAETAHMYKPGLSTGGNIFEAVARSGKLGTRASQTSAFIAGQMVDGFIGGAGARYRSNVFTNAEAVGLYGDYADLVPETDRLMLDGGMGMVFSTFLGLGFRFGGRKFLNQFRENKPQLGFDDFAQQKLDAARTEKEQLRALYGTDDVSGVKAYQAARAMNNDATLQISLATNKDLGPEQLPDFTKLIGNLNQGIPSIEFNFALGRVIDNLKGRTISEESLALRVLEDPGFIRALEGNERLTPEALQNKIKYQRAHLARLTGERDVDPDIDKKINEGKSREEAIAELRAERLEEIKQKQAELEEREAIKAAEAEAEAIRKAKAEEQRLKEEADKAAEDVVKAKAEAEAARKAAEEQEAELEAKAKESPEEEIDSGQLQTVKAKAEEAETKVTEADKQLAAITQKQEEFDFDAALKKQQERQRADRAVVDREREALSQREEDIRLGRKGGAGGLDDTALVHVDYQKTLELEQKKQKLERAERYLGESEALQPDNAWIRRNIDPEWDREGPEVVSRAEVKKIIEARKQKLEEEAKEVTDQDLANQEILDNEGVRADAELFLEGQKVQTQALHNAFLAAGRGDFTGDPARFRSVRVRTDDQAEIDTLAAREDAKKRNAKYSREDDLDSLREAEVGLAALQRQPSLGTKTEDIGTATYDSLAAVFADTKTLKDIDLENVFGEAIVEGTTPATMRFDMDKARQVIRQRIDAAEPIQRNPDALLTPQQLRLRQASEIADWRASNAARRAADSESGFAGAADAQAWEDGFWSSLMLRLKETGNNKNAAYLRSPQALKDYINSQFIPYMRGELIDLGNGKSDFVTPKMAAFAIADIVHGKSDGRTRYKTTINELNEETGVTTQKTTDSEFIERISHAQPGTDREIARVLAKLEYDARMEAIVRLDFDSPGQPSLDQAIKFIKDGNLQQDNNRALNREEFATRAFWIPPALRTNLDRIDEDIDARIERVTNELLEEDFTAYDILHDDFKTRQGDWGVAVEDANGIFFKNHGVAGGFPVASAMPNPEEGYSFGMAVLDAHMLLHPQTWMDTISAQKRGQMLRDEITALEAKDKLSDAEAKRLQVLKSGSYVTSIDGSQNGVRHAHAMAMLEGEQAFETLAEFVAKGTGKKRDFYQDLRTTTLKFFQETDDPRAKIWLNLGLVQDAVKGRKFAKKPVMVLPYGAGKKAITNSIRDSLKELPAEKLREFDAEADRIGASREELINYLGTEWFGKQQEKKAGLIQKALDLPDADAQMKVIMADSSKTDPYRQLADEPDRSVALKGMLDEAQKLSENTGMDLEEAFYAVQIQTRALAITRADDIPLEAAAQMARRQFAREMNLMHEAKKSGDYSKVIAAGEAGEMGFVENSLRAMMRSEYVQSESAQARATMDQTGQAGARIQLPEEAEGSFFAQQLMDWRSRMVTPRNQEFFAKGRKSERAVMDILQVLEEGESVVYKTSKAEAEADLHRVDDDSLTSDEWFAKHIDEEKTIASGVFGLRDVELRDRPRGKSKRRVLEEKAMSLKGKELEAELKRLNIKNYSRMKAVEKRAAVRDALIEAEKLRIKKLVVKSAMAEAAPEFAPPVRLDEAGNVAQMSRLTEAEKMDRWEAHSEDIRNSNSRASEIYSRLDKDGKKAYEKNYGRPMESLVGPNGEPMVQEKVITSEAFAKLEDAGEVSPQASQTMGGALGTRPIHPTEATDMMLGVPAVRELAQNRSMGQQGITTKTKDGKIQKTTKRIEIDGEASGLQAVRRIQDGGDIVSRAERHRVTHTDETQLPIIDKSEEMFDPELLGRMPDETRDLMIQTTLTRHATKFGLSDLVEAEEWGEIYAHLVWRKNMEAYGKDLKKLQTMAQRKNESSEAYMKRRQEAEMKLFAKWEQTTRETREGFEKAANDEWDSHKIDPFKKIQTVDARDAEGKPLTRREAILRSAKLRSDGSLRSDVSAAQRTNIDLIAGESIDGVRHAGSEMPAPIEMSSMSTVGGLLPMAGRSDNKIYASNGEDLGSQGFARSRKANGQAGEYVAFDDLSDNAILKVHFVHSKDRAGATGSVGMREDISLLAGLTTSNGKTMTVAEARDLLANAGSESGEGSIIAGSKGNVRFFTTDGIEVIDGIFAGHNIRRNGTRNEHYWILQNSANRFLGDRLSVSALTQRPVRRHKSTWELMDDRVRRKTAGTRIANENKVMLDWLKEKDPKAIKTSSFLGNVMDLGQYWARPEFRDRLYMSEYDRTLADAKQRLGIEATEITNNVHSETITNLRNYMLDVPEGKLVSEATIRSLANESTRTRRTDSDITGEPSRTLVRTGNNRKDVVTDNWITKTTPAELVKGKKQFSADQVNDLIADLEADQDSFNPSIKDPIEAREGDEGFLGSRITPNEIKFAKQIAGLQMLSGNDLMVIDADYIARMAPATMEGIKASSGMRVENIVVLANEGIAHMRKMRKLVSLANQDGVTGHGMTGLILRLASDGEIDLDNVTDATYARINRAWHDHEVGGADRGADNLNSPEVISHYQHQINNAKKILASEDKDPFSDTTTRTFQGDFVDQAGQKRSPEYFMEADNYSRLSGEHARFNDFLEDLLASETLDLPQVRMLRATTAQMDGRIFAGLKLEELTDADFRAQAKELGLGSAKKARARALSYSKGSFGLSLLKGRIGRDIDAVDVILHEVGHVSINRMLAENSPELEVARNMAKSAEGEAALREMVKVMHGGKFTQEAARQFKYFKKDPDEFLAAWFSYTMMSRTLDDKATIVAAYRAHKGWGTAIANIVRKMASYAYRRMSGFSRALSGLEPSYGRKMNEIMDHLAGRTDVAPMDKPNNFAAFHAEADGRAANVKAAEAEVEALRAAGVEENEPLMINALKDLQTAIDEALDTSDPAHFGGDGFGGRTLRDFLAEKVEERFTEDGIINFGRMVKEDPTAAEQFLAVHLLPKLQEGRYANVEGVTRSMVEDSRMTTSEKVSLRTRMDNIILSPSNASHTVNSRVQLQIGDTRFSLMQLISELVDNHSVLTQARLNGNQFSTLTAQARALESNIVRPMAMLDDELRMALAKSTNNLRGKSRTLATAGNEDFQMQLASLREIAGKRNLPRGTKLRKTADAEFEKLDPQVKEVVDKMTKQFAKASGEVKSAARLANLIGQRRAEASGLVPIRLRAEHMTDKSKVGGFGPELTKRYESSMLKSKDLDMDTLIGVGLLPSPGKVIDEQDLYTYLKNAEKNGFVDKDALEIFASSPRFRETVQAIRKGGFAEIPAMDEILTIKGRNLYMRGISEGTDAFTSDGGKHITARFTEEVVKSGSAAGKVYYQTNSSGAQLRALGLGRRAGSTSYYFGGDAYMDVDTLFDELGEFFDYDVRTGSAALQRGIGMQSADAANMSRAFEAIGMKVRGLSVKSILDLLDDMALRRGNHAANDTMKHGVDHLRKAYERLGGGLPTYERTGNIVADGLARNATNVAMLKYGGNLGVAMLAETAVTTMVDIAPRMLITPVKTMTMVWRSMTESMSPIRKTQVARQLLYGMHIARDTVSMRSFDRNVDDLAVADPNTGWLTNTLRTGAGLTSKFSLAPTVQTFNKAFAASGAMDDLLTHLDSAVRMRELLDEAGGVKNKKEFQELAKKAGFGRNWTLALRMQDAGLLDPSTISQIREFANSSDAMTTRILDIDSWSDEAAKSAASRSSKATEMDTAIRGVRYFIEEAIAKNNVEPRVLDMKLTNNTGWSKLMDVFLSWPRAFYAQKSVVRPGSAFAGGAGHIAAFYAAQATWDAMYTTIQDLARGEDEDKILNEVTNDPAGWYMSKAARMPLFGIYSQGLEMLVDIGRNKAANLGAPIGYHTRGQGDIDLGSAPVIAAMNNFATTMMDATEVLYGTTIGKTNSLSTKDPQTMNAFNGILDMIPLANMLPAKVMRDLWQEKPNSMNAARGQAYYEMLQMKRQHAYWRKQLINKYR